MNMMFAGLIIAFCYMLGAIPFGLLVARFYGIGDLRKHGSGNIGATNVWRVAGGRAAVWVYLLDIAKGVAAVLIARLSGPDFMSPELWQITCGLTAILGHVFPVYIGFKGGKGVNTALGAMLMLRPLEVGIALAVFLLVVMVTRYVSLGSIVAAVAFPLAMIVEQTVLNKPVPLVYVSTGGVIALLVIAAHHKNIRRLLRGTENRFSFSIRTGETNTHG